MILSNLLAGVFMAASQFLIQGLTPQTDYSVVVTILRLFVLTSIPAAAVQTLLAQEIAGAVTDEAQRDASATARGALKITIGFWLVLLLFAAAFRAQINAWLQASDPNLIWAVMLLILFSLVWPLFLGFLQGRQSFFAFGWSTILNGLTRCASIAIGVKLFKIGANGATYGALGGFVIGIVVAIWPARFVFQPKPGTFHWRRFFKKAALLIAGSGSTLFLINVDMLFIQGFFPKEVTGFYGAVETIGIAVVLICVPVAAVMFPKIVRSRATSSSSDALRLAVTGTIVIACSVALFCTIFPWLPLRVLFPKWLDSTPLVPWFMWAMVPVTVYNVLINNLIARERWGIIPWAAVLPIAYAVTLYLFLSHTHLPPFATFKRVIQILMGYSTTLMLISLYFSRPASSSLGGGANRSPSTSARPS
jgi:O-antigen/teichoic acid export membrane protein